MKNDSSASLENARYFLGQVRAFKALGARRAALFYAQSARDAFRRARYFSKAA